MIGGKSYNQIAGLNLNRIGALSDGVFSIAMTLLVLDLRVPVSEVIRSEKELIELFVPLLPKLTSYFMGFMTLGIFWTGHSAQFYYIEKSDRNLNWISLFFLLFVSLLPFTTAFLSEHIHFIFSVMLYWFNIFLLGILLYFHWVYAEKHLFIEKATHETHEVGNAIRRRILAAQLLYLGGALLAFVNTYISIAVIIIIQLNYALAPLFRSEKSSNNKND